MPSITPHLWFASHAREAAEWYTSLFPQSKITSLSVLHDTPSGDTEIVAFELWGTPFRSISAGPLFAFNPSISIMVNFDPAQDPDAEARIDAVWQALAEGGQVLMPLDQYPFSARYGWVQDRYGLSWQLILTNPEGEVRPPVITSMLFVGDVCGKAEEATDFYLSLFPNSRRGALTRWPRGADPEREGSLMFTDFQLAGSWYTAQDSAQPHNFAFNEAISLMVHCDSQEEVDHYWNALSAVPEAEQCGWLKDRYGVSWQIVPAALDEMMGSGTPQQVDRVTQAFLPMKKLDVAALRAAFDAAQE